MKAQLDARRTADFLAGQSGFEDLQTGDKRRITGMKRIRVPDIFHEGVHLLRRKQKDSCISSGTPSASICNGRLARSSLCGARRPSSMVSRSSPESSAATTSRRP